MSEKRDHSSNKALLPIYFSLVLALGIYVGSKLNFGSSQIVFQQENGPQTHKGKLDNVLDFIAKNYVDTINRNELEDKTLTAMLTSLDPHSDYIPAQDLERVNEPLQGNFDGIGIEFNLLNDTITVVSPINGGPSEKAGIIPGDKIVLVDGKNVAGIQITNKKVFESLRGERGSKVTLGIKRNGIKQLLEITLRRDQIPIYSLDVSYMVNKEIGYIKISRFGATTFEEYRKAFNQLSKRGMKSLILDLRGNGGGYLNAAVNLIDEFLKKGMMIVYTEGKASPKQKYVATDVGGFEDGKLIILTDEGSASASEIVAGAIQDNDRGIIIGRRTFGKGLVQEQMEMPDGSALRLTTARYYTPSGRCIQKPYSNGHEAYYSEEYDRYENGELHSADSIKVNDSLKFYTAGGKVVYGGGGIIPDFFVGLDTSYRTSFLNKIFYSGLINDFSFSLTDKYRIAWKKQFNKDNFMTQFTLPAGVMNDLVKQAQAQKIPCKPEDLKKSESYIKNYLKAMIGKNLFGNEVFYPVLHSQDNVMIKAIEQISTRK